MPEAREILTSDITLNKKDKKFRVNNEDWEMTFSYSENQAPEILKALEETRIDFNFFMWGENVVTHIL